MWACSRAEVQRRSIRREAMCPIRIQVGRLGETVYFPSSPMKYIQRHAPNAKVEFNPGTDNASAAALAKTSDVAIVFVKQPMYESHDARTLSLPDNQDALVSAVASANPHTIVVLETGGPVSMPSASRWRGSWGLVSGDRRRAGDCASALRRGESFGEAAGDVRQERFAAGISGGSGDRSEAGGCPGTHGNARTTDHAQ